MAALQDNSGSYSPFALIIRLKLAEIAAEQVTVDGLCNTAMFCLRPFLLHT